MNVMASSRAGYYLPTCITLYATFGTLGESLNRMRKVTTTLDIDIRPIASTMNRGIPSFDRSWNEITSTDPR